MSPRLRSKPGRRRGKGTKSTARLRRSRLLLLGSAAFAVLVVATSMPFSTLLSQRSQLAGASSQLSSLRSQNRLLRREAGQLSDPSTLAGIARRDYGLVSPGSVAYEILPAPGSSVDAAQDSGHVPLDGPLVSPGSAQSQAILAAGELSGAPSQAAGASSEASSSGAAQADGAGGAGAASAKSTHSASGASGFWSRVVGSLEFWR